MSEKERDSLWQIIAEARDAWPRVPEDCPTDELVHLIESNWLADHDRRIKAEAWDEGHAAPSDSGHWETNKRRADVRNWFADPTPNPYREEVQS